MYIETFEFVYPYFPRAFFLVALASFAIPCLVYVFTKQLMWPSNYNNKCVICSKCCIMRYKVLLHGFRPSSNNQQMQKEGLIDLNKFFTVSLLALELSLEDMIKIQVLYVSDMDK